MGSWTVFRIVMTLALAGTAYLVGRRLTGGLSSPLGRTLVWAGLAAFLGIQVLTSFFTRRPEGALAWVVYVSLGVFVTVLFLTLATDLSRGLLAAGRWAASRWVGGPEVDPGRRTALLAFLPWGILGSSTALAATGLYQARVRPRLREVRVPIPGLHPALEGYRIAQVTDLHVGPTIKRPFVEAVASVVAEARPDLLALTGDFVDGTVEAIGAQLDPLSDLRPRDGIVFTPGNHEIYWGLDAWLAEWRRRGAHVLANAHLVIERGGAKLVVAGIHDHQTVRLGDGRRASAEEAMRGAPEGDLTVFLSHQPQGFAEGEKAGADLQLSGHTHAGQFFPISLVHRFVHRYWRGLNRHSYAGGEFWVYVGNGAGYWGPPNRLGVPSEVALLVLTKA